MFSNLVLLSITCLGVTAMGPSVFKRLFHWLLPRLTPRLLASFFGLASPRPGRLRYLGGLEIPGGAEGVSLSSYAVIRDGGQAPSPTLVVRTPYGKAYLEIVAFALAGQGFNVLVQDCRGRYRSSGSQSFAGFEDQDGAATLRWLERQAFEWHDPERIVMFGISYLGIVQWAAVAGLERTAGSTGPSCIDGAALAVSEVASTDAPARSRIVGIAPLFASSRCHDIFFRKGAFCFDFYIRYLHLMTRVNSYSPVALVRAALDIVKFTLDMRRFATSSLGVRALSEKLGVPVLFKHNPRPDARFWRNRDYSDALACAPPAFIATGWHDIMLEGSLRDYSSVVEAHGLDHARLLVGPWHHLESILSLTAFRTLLRSSIDFLQERVGLLDPAEQEWQASARARVWVMGPRSHQGRWRNFSQWPPRETEQLLFLLAHRALRADAVLGGAFRQASPFAAGGAEGVSRVRYDPMDPTPSVGGALFDASEAGEREQGLLAARRDVLLFDSLPLREGVTVVGAARLRAVVRASRPHFDLFARLCDVHPSGRSYNVCDAILRRCAPPARSHSETAVGAFAPPTSECLLECDLDFAPTAKRFGAGHRLRLLVACGNFPRFARHFGDAEQACDDPLDIAPCDLEILHTEQLPSSLWLPVLPAACELGGTSMARRRWSLVQAAVHAGSLPQHHLELPKPSSPDSPTSLRKTQSVAAF